MDECQSQMEDLVKTAAHKLNLDHKSVKLECNPQLGFHFRVTLKDEKGLRNNKSFRMIDTNKSGVRFRNDDLQEINEVYQRARKDYEQHQQGEINSELRALKISYLIDIDVIQTGVVKDVLEVAGTE